MKRIIFSLYFVLLISVSCDKKQEPVNNSNKILQEPIEQNNTVVATPEEEGKLLIAGADCLTCHKNDATLIGPSYQDIAKKYTEKDIDLLADKIVKGGSGVWGDVPMAAHTGLDKENAKKMVKYILSNKK